MSDVTLVELTTAPTAIEGEWIVGALDAQGVRATIFDAALAGFWAEFAGPVVGVRVMVMSDELERAREALSTIPRGGRNSRPTT